MKFTTQTFDTEPPCITCTDICCKNQEYISLSEEESKRLLHTTIQCTYYDFDLEKDIQITEYRMKLKENGECHYLQLQNGVDRCSIYNKRAEICRHYDCRREDACNQHI